jgi:hypothetical protein
MTYDRWKLRSDLDQAVRNGFVGSPRDKDLDEGLIQCSHCRALVPYDEADRCLNGSLAAWLACPYCGLVIEST